MKLDDKINEVFGGCVVRKDLSKAIKGNAVVPTYVLEYLLSQYCTTNNEEAIKQGIDTVKNILAKHYVHRGEAGLIRSNIKQKGRQTVIDKISVELNAKKDCYEATLSNLGIKKVPVSSDVIKKHPKLLVSGIWCIAKVAYEFVDDSTQDPWTLDSIKPIQLSNIDVDHFLEGRAKFSTEEWIDLLIQSIGLNPEKFSPRAKLIQLTRLIPFCERNYNLIELGPKGTGKSHVYSEFSPHGILISGGEVTVPKLFVNNSNGKIGLVGFWDCIAFDEFAGVHKKVDKSLVDIMKNYMANKSFSRGVEILNAEASMSFVGNTQHDVDYMMKFSDLFCDLPPLFHDSAFLDRIHCYIPGWEVEIIKNELFSSGYGFVVDYLAEILRKFRDTDFSDKYQDYFDLSKEISTRDRDGIKKTFSGLMKLIHPTGQADQKDVETILRYAIEGRERVKNQIMRFDSTFEPVNFAYFTKAGQEIEVFPLEEGPRPDSVPAEGEAKEIEEPRITQPVQTIRTKEIENTPTEQHKVFQEGSRGITYKLLFKDYLVGATDIVVTDPYIRNFYQQKNFFDFLVMLLEFHDPSKELHVSLKTTRQEDNDKQEENFETMKREFERVGILFDWSYESQNLHARHIITDTGWKISLDRGLDIFRYYDTSNAFSLVNKLQEQRIIKSFEVTYIKLDSPSDL